MNYKIIGFCVLILFVVYFFTTLSTHAEADKDGKTFFESKCGKCHPLSTALSKVKDLEEWQVTTLRMSKKKNSDIDTEQARIIAGYLSSLNSI